MAYESIVLNTNDGSVSDENIHNLKETNYRVYRTRWIVVIIFALLSCMNAYLWISFSPVANYFAEFYSTSYLILNLVSLIFPLITVILGIPIAYSIDYLGIRPIIWGTATCNLICGCLRAVSSTSYFNISSSARLALFILGQVIASFGQPFCLFSTTSLATSWFPDNQRTTGNTIASLGNALGIMFCNAFAPNYVKKSSDIVSFNYITLGIVIILFLLSITLVRKSEPPTPPSHVATLVKTRYRASESRNFLSLNPLLSFINSFIPLLKLYGFWIIMLTFGSCIGYFTVLSTFLQQMLCTKGYSNQFAGLCGLIMIIAGLIASGPFAVFVDRTGFLIETLKITFILSVLGCVGLSIVLWFSYQQVATTFCLICLGGFGFAQYSLSLEMAAEAAYPVSESVTTSLLIISSQLIAFIMLPVMQFSAPLAGNSTSITSTCGPEEMIQVMKF
uniref:MFS domain-containing protein n=1 Tax=Trichobilharzia regenti TaxID=157069 RepID=A0AA85KFP4_TRIRE|nr:unnamed protein product [Trichobilharzia regenti]